MSKKTKSWNKVFQLQSVENNPYTNLKKSYFANELFVLNLNSDDNILGKTNFDMNVRSKVYQI